MASPKARALGRWGLAHLVAAHRSDTSSLMAERLVAASAAKRQ